MKVNDIYVNITSEQPERLVEFYNKVVGLELKPDMGEGAMSIGPGATLGIDGHSDTRGRTKEPSRVLLDLFVDDVAAERKRLEAVGVSFIRKEGVEMWGGITSTFVDPDGNYCQLMQLPAQG